MNDADVHSRGLDGTAYWEDRYANTAKGAGAGSEGDPAKTKAEYVNALIEREAIRSVDDWGCGDGGFLTRLRVPDDYLGFDVSETALARARAAHPDKRFHLLRRGTTVVSSAELGLSLDVLFHLVHDAAYHEHLRLLFSATRFVCAHAADYDEERWGHMRFREWLRDVPAGWELLDRPADRHTIGFYLLARR